MKTGHQESWTHGMLPLLSPDIFAGIVSAVSDLSVILDASGVVQSVMVDADHPQIPALTHWQGKPLEEFLQSDSKPKLAATLQAFRTGQKPQRPVELNHCDPAPWGFPIRYSFHCIDAERGTLLLIGQDLFAVSQSQRQLMQAQIAMERGLETQRDFESRFRLVMTETQEALLFVSAQDGRIREASAAAAAVLNTPLRDLQGAALGPLFVDPHKDGLIDALVAHALSGEREPLRCKTRAKTGDLSISPSVYRIGAERLVLCRLHAAEPRPGTISADHDLEEALTGLYHARLDAVIFTTLSGHILRANDAFLQLTGLPHHSDYTGRSLADFLARHHIDLNVALDYVRRDGEISSYSTHIAATPHSPPAPIDLAAALISEQQSEGRIGFVLRRAAGARGPGPLSDDAQGGVQQDALTALVGTQPLRDIVAQATDTVEQLCIAAAISLTHNNRVAAAEMLGLSRQSLYVKLRKYGLLQKD